MSLSVTYFWREGLLGQTSLQGFELLLVAGNLLESSGNGHNTYIGGFVVSYLGWGGGGSFPLYTSLPAIKQEAACCLLSGEGS